jgi:superfamily II DNA or RNA helicase
MYALSPSPPALAIVPKIRAYPYQTDIISFLHANLFTHGKSLVPAGTGSGKTWTTCEFLRQAMANPAMAGLISAEQPLIVVLHEGVLLSGWLDPLIGVAGFKPWEIGIVSGSMAEELTGLTEAQRKTCSTSGKAGMQGRKVFLVLAGSMPRYYRQHGKVPRLAIVDEAHRVIPLSGFRLLRQKMRSQFGEKSFLLYLTATPSWHPLRPLQLEDFVERDLWAPEVTAQQLIDLGQWPEIEYPELSQRWVKTAADRFKGVAAMLEAQDEARVNTSMTEVMLDLTVQLADEICAVPHRFNSDGRREVFYITVTGTAASTAMKEALEGRWGAGTVAEYNSKVRGCTVQQLKDSEFLAVIVIDCLQAGVSVNPFSTAILARFFVNSASLIQAAGRLQRQFGMNTRFIDPVFNFGRMPLVQHYRAGDVVGGIPRTPDAQICANPACLAVHATEAIIPRRRPKHVSDRFIRCPECRNPLFGDLARVRAACAERLSLEAELVIPLGLSLGLAVGRTVTPMTTEILLDLGFWPSPADKKAKEKVAPDDGEESGPVDRSGEFLARVEAAREAINSIAAKQARGEIIPAALRRLPVEASNAARLTKSAPQARAALSALVGRLFMETQPLDQLWLDSAAVAGMFTMGRRKGKPVLVDRSAVPSDVEVEDAPALTITWRLIQESLSGFCGKVKSEHPDRAEEVAAMMEAWIYESKTKDQRRLDGLVAKGQQSEAAKIESRLKMADMMIDTIGSALL